MKSLDFINLHAQTVNVFEDFVRAAARAGPLKLQIQTKLADAGRRILGKVNGIGVGGSGLVRLLDVIAQLAQLIFNLTEAQFISLDNPS